MRQRGTALNRSVSVRSEALDGQMQNGRRPERTTTTAAGRGYCLLGSGGGPGALDDAKEIKRDTVAA